MSDAAARVFEGPFGALYSFYTERPRISRVIATLLWRSDIRPFYASLRTVAGLPDGATVVDAPCGAGVAFRALRPDKPVDYLAFDLSPAMLERARRRAGDLGLGQVRLAQADAESLPVEDASADVFLSYFGLHCFPHPDTAVREIARCLRPGGRLVGSSIVQGSRPLDRLLVRPHTGAWGPVGTAGDLRRWFAEAGLEAIEIDRRGLFAYFRARRPGR